MRTAHLKADSGFDLLAMGRGVWGMPSGLFVWFVVTTKLDYDVPVPDFRSTNAGPSIALEQVRFCERDHQRWVPRLDEEGT